MVFLQINQLHVFTSIMLLASVSLKKSDFKYFELGLNLIHSLFGFSLGNNSLIAFFRRGNRHCVFTFSSIFAKSRQFVLTISKYNKHTTIPEDCRESALKKSLWWPSYFINPSPFFLRHLLKHCNHLLSSACSVSALCTKHPSTCKNPPMFPFDQSHSRLIKPWITLNRSN